jgi:hypothetical protein
VLSGGLKYISFKDCPDVDLEVLRAVCEERGWANPRCNGNGLVIEELQAPNAADEKLETRSLGQVESGQNEGAHGLGTGGRGGKSLACGGVIDVDPMWEKKGRAVRAGEV